VHAFLEEHATTRVARLGELVDARDIRRSWARTAGVSSVS
jgi:hypothetical protein